VDAAVSYRMQVDHGFAQPLELLLDGLGEKPVIPVFINSVAVPLPSFARARLLGEAIGRFARSTGKRVLFLGSGGCRTSRRYRSWPTSMRAWPTA
jgi:2,3-dihydroxyphenylpropionate 1,2-dioxygenase (EC 1.13.11.16)